MKIVFFGTPEFAIPSIIAILENGWDVCAVVTQPDKPKGRGNKHCISAIKKYALENEILILQPKSAKSNEFFIELQSLNPDLLVTAAYGKILPEAILDIPKYGCINIHASLLPAYRGAGPIQWSIIKGEKVTGITTMFTDIGLDTGDMLLSQEVDITDNMTSGELHDILKAVGASLIIDTIQKLIDNKLQRIPQDNNKSTYAPILTKEIGKINWDLTPAEIHNLVRGINPCPGAYTYYMGDRMRVWKTFLIDDPELKGRKNGQIIEICKHYITVACGGSAIGISEIQFDCCRRMCVGDYLCGHEIIEGEIFGY